MKKVEMVFFFIHMLVMGSADAIYERDKILTQLAGRGLNDK